MRTVFFALSSVQNRWLPNRSKRTSRRRGSFINKLECDNGFTEKRGISHLQFLMQSLFNSIFEMCWALHRCLFADESADRKRVLVIAIINGCR